MMDPLIANIDEQLRGKCGERDRLRLESDEAFENVNLALMGKVQIFLGVPVVGMDLL